MKEEEIKNKETAFNEYWTRRVKYRHPEENKTKLKIFARKMYYAGWDTGSFEQRKEMEKK
jgi:hypothetical protein